MGTCAAANQSLEEDEGQGEGELPDELAKDILQWAAQGLFIFLSSNNSQASFNKTLDWWKSCRHVQETFQQALPDSYKKVLGFLEAQYATASFLYDRYVSCISALGVSCHPPFHLCTAYGTHSYLNTSCCGCAAYCTHPFGCSLLSVLANVGPLLQQAVLLCSTGVPTVH